jgi:hypothetical protein
MTQFFSNKNTLWRIDRTGAYVEFAQNTRFIEVSINFENQLESGEVINTAVADSDAIAINTAFPFFLTGRKGNYQLAVIQFDLLDNDPGMYPVNLTVTTSQNRTYKRHFRVKVV